MASHERSLYEMDNAELIARCQDFQAEIESLSQPDIKPAASFLAGRARLWETLKKELEADARGKNLSGQEKGFRETNASKRATEFLERMRRMEDRS